MTDKNELLRKLLKQVNFHLNGEDGALLQAGEIKNVDVYSQERRWDIHVFFDTPLQFVTYNALNTAIKNEFADFVDVSLYVETADGSQQHLPDYWHFAVENSQSLASQPAAQAFLAEQTPRLDSQRWVIPVNEIGRAHV